jgi:hypothetical protein
MHNECGIGVEMDPRRGALLQYDDDDECTYVAEK